MNQDSTLKKAFDLFVSADNIRPTFNAPFEFKDYVYATDVMVLIRCKKENIDFEITNDGKVPKDIEAIIPKENMSKVLCFDRDKFNAFMLEDEYTGGEDVECDTCNGEGEVEWEFEHYTLEADCPVCDGSGIQSEGKKIMTGRKTFAKTDLVKLNGIHLSAQRFNTLLKAQDIIGGEITAINLGESISPSMFRVGNCEVLLMGIRYIKEDDKVILEINL